MSPRHIFFYKIDAILYEWINIKLNVNRVNIM